MYQIIYATFYFNIIYIFLGKTTLLVPKVYLVCTIGPLSLKLVQLVP